MDGAFRWARRDVFKSVITQIFYKLKIQIFLSENFNF